MANDDYQQISCSHHDQIEAAVVTRKICELTYRIADGEEQMIRVRLKDILSREGKEFALTESGEEIRLDRILTLDGVELGE